MLRGSAWAARRDQAFARVEDPRQRRLADWKDQRTRRRAELEEKTARREAEFTALFSAISAQVAAEVSAAVAAALQTARVGHHEGLNHAPTTTSAPTTSMADDHDLNRAPATTSITTRSVAANYDPTATSTSPAPPSVLTECLVREGNLAIRPPTPCLMLCPGGVPSSPSAVSNPAEVLEPVASPPPIPAAVPYSYSSVTGPAPHADIQLARKVDLQPEVFTSAIAAPLSATAHKADLALTKVGVTSATAYAELEFGLTTATPNTCSTECPEQENGDPNPLATSMLASMVLCEAAVTTSCMARGGCIYPKAQWVVMPTPDPVDVVDSIWTMAAPCVDITLRPRALTPATTKPASSATLESDLVIASPTTVSVVFRNLVPDVPAAVLTQATLKIAKQQLVCSCVNQLHPICSDIDWGACVKHLDAEGQVLRPMPWPSFRYHSEVVNHAKPCSATQGIFGILSTGQPHDDRDSYDGYLILHWTSFSDENNSQVLCADQVDFEGFLLGSFSHFQRNFEPCFLEASEYLSADSVPHRYAPVTIGNAFICGSSHFQWYIAWSYTLAQADVRTIHLARPTINLNTTEAPASDPSIATVRLFTVWTSDLIIYICVEQIEAHLSRSGDQHQKKSGYVKTHINSHWHTQVFCSSENVIGKFYGQCISVQLLQYQFDCASTLGKLHVERIFACAPGYPAICAEQVLFEHFLLEFFYSRSNSHPLYLEAWAYLSLASSSVPYPCAPVTVGLFFPYGSVSVPWKNSGSNLFDIWRANWSCEFGPYILQSQTAALLLMAGGNTTLMGPIEQWDPGIARCFGGSAYVSYVVRTIGNQKIMDDNFDDVDLLSRVQAVRSLHIQSSLNHAIVGRSSEQAEAEGIGNLAAATNYHGHYLDHDSYFNIARANHDYYIDVFSDQVHLGHDYFLVRAIGYLNLVKVHLDYGIQPDLGEVMKHQVPWDPGGSTWHRLEVKPKFKEGGMLATLPSLTWAGPWAGTFGPGPLGNDVRKKLQIQGNWLTNKGLGLGTDGFGLLCFGFCLLFLSTALCSSSSSLQSSHEPVIPWLVIPIDDQ